MDSPIRANYFHEWEMEHAENSFGDELAMRLDADIQLDDGWLDSIARRRAPRRSRTAGELVDLQLGFGAAALGRAERRQPYFLNQGRWEDTTSARPGLGTWSAVVCSAAGTFLHPRCDTWTTTRTTSICTATATATAGPLGARTNCPVNRERPGGLYCPVEQQNVTEDVDAAYVMLKFGGDDTKIGNVSVRGNIGVRYVKTDGHGTGGIQFPIWTPPAPHRRRLRAEPDRMIRSPSPRRMTSPS